MIVFEVALIGALIGTLNGLFVGDPDLPEHQRRFTFSFVDFSLGAGVALVYLTVMEVVEWRVFGVAGISPVTDFVTAVPDLLVIAFAGVSGDPSIDDALAAQKRPPWSLSMEPPLDVRWEPQ